MTFASYMTPVKRLHLLAVQAIRESRRSVDRATPRFFNLIAEDPDLLLELVGKDVARDIARQYLQEIFDRDMNGGGIGLRPANETGGDAVADEAGQSSYDAQSRCARPSAPQSQTPAEKPVGGGQETRDVHQSFASPTPGNANYTMVKQHPRLLPGKTPSPGAAAWSPSNIAPAVKSEPKPKAPYVAPKPRIAFADRVQAENRYAKTILDTFMLRGRPIGDWTHEELSNVAEITGREHRIAEAFKRVTPAGGRVRDYVKAEDAETLARSVELANAS